MSSSIYNDNTAWHVSNVMFARVLEFASELGAELASTEREREWLRDLASKTAGFDTYSPDVSIRELFTEVEQLEFWHLVVSELGLRIYKREIGNQSDQTWQVSTIWAAIDLARVLDSSAQQLRSRSAE